MQTPNTAEQSSSAQTLLPIRRLEREQDLLPATSPEQPPAPLTAQRLLDYEPSSPTDIGERAHSPVSKEDAAAAAISPETRGAAEAEPRQSESEGGTPSVGLWDHQPIQPAMPWNDDDGVGPLGPQTGTSSLLSSQLPPESTSAHTRVAEGLRIGWSVTSVLHDLRAASAADPASDSSPEFDFQAATLQVPLSFTCLLCLECGTKGVRPPRQNRKLERLP